MMEGNAKGTGMKNYLNKALEETKPLDETLVAANIRDRIRVALENVPEWVKMSVQGQEDTIQYVWDKTKPTDYGAT